jgi:hypothetical protein
LRAACSISEDVAREKDEVGPERHGPIHRLPEADEVDSKVARVDVRKMEYLDARPRMGKARHA